MGSRPIINTQTDKIYMNTKLMSLVGKTVTGTFFMKDPEPYVRHWIRWNEKKSDNIFVPKDVAHSIFGGPPKSGAKVTTIITSVGPDPDSARPNRLHPHCETFHIIRMPLYDTNYSKNAAETLKTRKAELLGRTVTGTLCTAWDLDSETKYYIRWNDKRADNVSVQKDVVHAAFHGNPVSGTKVCATITALGPKNKGVSPWRMNPMCTKITIMKRWRPCPARSMFGGARSGAGTTERRPRMTTETPPSGLSATSSRWSISPALSRLMTAGSESIWTPQGGSFVERERLRRSYRPSTGSQPGSRQTSPQTPPFTRKVYARVSGRARTVTLGSAFAKRAALEL